VSVASDGTQSNNSSGFVDPPALSGDGSLVAFATSATNLVPGDTNNAMDIVLHDRVAGTTILVHVATDGTQGNAGSVLWPQISADGRVISFTSTASNLVANDTNAVQDVFVYADTCGNGVLDAGEECDDGNALDGDCCSARCRFEPAGSACSDGNACTQVDACDGAGTCVGSSPVVCGGSADGCQSAPTCDPASGQCVRGTAVDGTECDDGDACTVGDACVDGVCVPGEVEPAACLDSFRCYSASLSWFDLFRFRSTRANLADALGNGSFWLGPPTQICVPARVGDAPDEPVPDLSGALLSCRHIDRVRTSTSTPAFVAQRLTVSNQLGAQTITAYAPRRVCLGAGVAGAPTPGAIDPFTCYAAAVSPGAASPVPKLVAIADGLATTAMVVVHPELFCSPTSIGGSVVTHAKATLACYELRPPDRYTIPHVDPRLLQVVTSLGPEKLIVFGPRRLCLPTRVDGATPEPPADGHSGPRR
jgi:cysteine-rich repeat protein